jgi:hypothetical protein
MLSLIACDHVYGLLAYIKIVLVGAGIGRVREITIYKGL